MNSDAHHDTLLKIAIAAAREAGKEILSLYAATDYAHKADGSPITIADTRSNEILLTHLRATKISILSEESEGIPLPYPSPLWIIDPLDGTRDFISKTNDFSVMVGLLEHGRPTLGVVYAPVHDTLYFAEKGTGAYVIIGDGVPQKLHVGTGKTEPLRFIRSMNHFTPDMEAVATALHATLLPRGSIGIKAGLLGSQYGDFFYSKGGYGEWDICAPEIITLEAGGTVTDCLGAPMFYGTPNHKVAHGAVFSNGHCHTQVLEAIRATTTPQ